MKLKIQLAILVITAFSFSIEAQTSKNESAARKWITTHAEELGIKDFHDFKLSFARKSLSGETLRFQQMVRDVPVFESEIVVHFSPKNKITTTANSYDAKAANIDTAPAISKESAIAKSDQVLEVTGNISFQECKLFVYNKFPETKLVYRVVTNSEFKIGSWETIIDAKNGAVLSTKDIALYYHKEKPKKKGNAATAKNNLVNPAAFVGGTAMVYNPDPLSVAGVTYAGNYRDLSDATNAQLDAARSSVALPEIELLAGVYKLKSSYVEIKNLGAPNKGLFTQATADFNFNRNQDGFEAATAFYHLDKNLRYINETLGITCRPLTNDGILFFDPSSVDGEDQSFYSEGELNFGEGGVDDAEDADVILHELGHGIHDWITNGGLSQVNGLSEGCGDYWAMSYSRSLNQWPSTNPAYHYVFSWDGHNQFWSGRLTNVTRLYPGGLVNQVHSDGEIWATCLMKIYDQVGRTKMDTAFLEGLSATAVNTNQQQAAIAIRQAAIDLNYPCTDIQKFTTIFTATGYTMPALNVTINCPDTQTVYVPVGTNYTVPSFASLSNAISQNCNAVITQNPGVGLTLPIGTYQVEMTATSGTTDTCTFTLEVAPLLGTDQKLLVRGVAIFPNPASDVVTIKGKFDAGENISIFNLLGQKVMDAAINSNEEKINVSKLANGVYSIYFNNARAAYKFVKE